MSRPGKSTKAYRSPWLWLGACLLAIAALARLGPAEKSLGVNVRVVYLHGAWVWAALAGFIAAGLVGLAGLATRRPALHRWSRALGRSGLLFWITYLPISIWAMQTNWNGLYLAEPRWRLAAVFALGGLILQTGLTLMEDPAWTSAGNLVFLLALLMALRGAEDVMHPASPIFGSQSWRIQLFFGALLLITLFAAWQVARLFHRLEERRAATG